MAKVALYLALFVAVAVIAGSDAQRRRCPRNQVWTECRSSCPKTCAQPNGPEACIQLCQPAGCQCRPNFVLDAKNNCVLQRNCPSSG